MKCLQSQFSITGETVYVQIFKWGKTGTKFRTVWTLKESTENVKDFSHIGNQPVSPLIKGKKKSFVASEPGKKNPSSCLSSL